MSDRSGRRAPGRPPSTTVEAIERAAIDLLLRQGYDAVSVEDLATAAGISRATYFRYFPTKAAVVWLGFDRALDQLQASLAQVTVQTATLPGLRAAVADSVRAGVDRRGVWWERFRLLDEVPALRSEATDRWDRWSALVAGFVAARMGEPAGHPIPMAIAFAHRGVYVASLRNWQGDPGDPEAMLDSMLESMRVLGDALGGLLDRS